MMRSRREEQRLLKWKQENDAAREAEAKRLEEEASSKGSAPEHASWPPPTNHAPVSACLACGSDDLVETRDSALMFTVKDRPDASYVAYPTLINFVVCRRCGRLELFANEPSAFVTAYQHSRQTARSLPGVPFPQGAPPPWQPPMSGRPADETATAKPQPPPPAIDPAPGAPPKPKYRRRATDRESVTHETAAPHSEGPATEVLPVTKDVKDVEGAEPPPKSRRAVRRIEKLER
jgi:hypothetical protein